MERFRAVARLSLIGVAVAIGIPPSLADGPTPRKNTQPQSPNRFPPLPDMIARKAAMDRRKERAGILTKLAYWSTEVGAGVPERPILVLHDDVANGMQAKAVDAKAGQSKPAGSLTISPVVDDHTPILPEELPADEHTAAIPAVLPPTNEHESSQPPVLPASHESPVAESAAPPDLPQAVEPLPPRIPKSTPPRKPKGLITAADKASPAQREATRKGNAAIAAAKTHPPTAQLPVPTQKRGMKHPSYVRSSTVPGDLSKSAIQSRRIDFSKGMPGVDPTHVDPAVVQASATETASGVAVTPIPDLPTPEEFQNASKQLEEALRAAAKNKDDSHLEVSNTTAASPADAPSPISFDAPLPDLASPVPSEPTKTSNKSTPQLDPNTHQADRPAATLESSSSDHPTVPDNASVSSIDVPSPVPSPDPESTSIPTSSPTTDESPSHSDELDDIRKELAQLALESASAPSILEDARRELELLASPTPQPIPRAEYSPAPIDRSELNSAKDELAALVELHHHASAEKPSETPANNYAATERAPSDLPPPSTPPSPPLAEGDSPRDSTVADPPPIGMKTTTTTDQSDNSGSTATHPQTAVNPAAPVPGTSPGASPALITPELPPSDNSPNTATDPGIQDLPISVKGPQPAPMDETLQPPDHSATVPSTNIPTTAAPMHPRKIEPANVDPPVVDPNIVEPPVVSPPRLEPSDSIPGVAEPTSADLPGVVGAKAPTPKPDSPVPRSTHEESPGSLLPTFHPAAVPTATPNPPTTTLDNRPPMDPATTVPRSTVAPSKSDTVVANPASPPDKPQPPQSPSPEQEAGLKFARSILESNDLHKFMDLPKGEPSGKNTSDTSMALPKPASSLPPLVIDGVPSVASNQSQRPDSPTLLNSPDVASPTTITIPVPSASKAKPAVPPIRLASPVELGPSSPISSGKATPNQDLSSATQLPTPHLPKPDSDASRSIPPISLGTPTTDAGDAQDAAIDVTGLAQPVGSPVPTGQCIERLIAAARPEQRIRALTDLAECEKWYLTEGATDEVVRIASSTNTDLPSRLLAIRLLATAPRSDTRIASLLQRMARTDQDGNVRRAAQSVLIQHVEKKDAVPNPTP